MLWDSNKNNDITYFEDLVKELSKEEDIPYEEMEEICSLSLKYIKHLTDDKDTLSILVPNLGTMYYSERFGEFYRNRFKKYNEGRNKKFKEETFKFLQHRETLIKKLEEEHNTKKSFHRRKPLLYKFKNIYKKMYGTIVRMGATLGYQELWTKFSELQNKIQNEEKNKFD